MMLEIGHLYFAKDSLGIVTFPMGALSAVQDISDSIQILPVSRIVFDKVYKTKGVSTSVRNDAVRYCFSAYAGIKFKKTKSNWFKKSKCVPNCEMIYWYLHRSNPDFEYYLKNIGHDKFSREDLIKFIADTPQRFEQVFSS